MKRLLVLLCVAWMVTGCVGTLIDTEIPLELRPVALTKENIAPMIAKADAHFTEENLLAFSAMPPTQVDKLLSEAARSGKITHFAKCVAPKCDPDAFGHNAVKRALDVVSNIPVFRCASARGPSGQYACDTRTYSLWGNVVTKSLVYDLEKKERERAAEALRTLWKAAERGDSDAAAGLRQMYQNNFVSYSSFEYANPDPGGSRLDHAAHDRAAALQAMILIYWSYSGFPQIGDSREFACGYMKYQWVNNNGFLKQVGYDAVGSSRVNRKAIYPMQMMFWCANDQNVDLGAYINTHHGKE